MKTYTAWGNNKGDVETFVEGTSRSCFADGTPQPDCEELMWCIEAETWEDEMAAYHVRQGWEAMQPAHILGDGSTPRNWKRQEKRVQ